MNTAIKDYLKFAKDVLGIKHLFFSGVPLVTTSLPRLHILVDNLATYSPDEKDLLQKMIGALKLDPASYLILDSTQHSESHSEFTLHLADKPQAAKQGSITTYSPRFLLLNAELKKKAWSDMQQLLKLMS